LIFTNSDSRDNVYSNATYSKIHINVKNNYTTPCRDVFKKRKISVPALVIEGC